MTEPTTAEVQKRADQLYAEWHTPWAWRRADDSYQMAKVIARRQLRDEQAASMAQRPADIPPEATPDDTPENVTAERERRLGAGEDYGYKALARHFISTSSTIRRRLGKLK